jgi:hypothetical protein
MLTPSLKLFGRGGAFKCQDTKNTCGMGIELLQFCHFIVFNYGSQFIFVEYFRLGMYDLMG